MGGSVIVGSVVGGFNETLFQQGRGGFLALCGNMNLGFGKYS